MENLLIGERKKIQVKLSKAIDLDNMVESYNGIHHICYMERQGEEK